MKTRRNIRVLDSRSILLCVSGSIAAYKAAEIASMLVQKGAVVDVVMTQSACKLISPITFYSLTGRQVRTDIFEDKDTWTVPHVRGAAGRDALLVAPATANIIAKAAHGFADDIVSCSILAASCPKIFAPAMNEAMYINAFTQRNIQILKDSGAIFIGPEKGYLACGYDGIGRMSSPQEIVSMIESVVSSK